MISRIAVENYKCFSRKNFPLAPLTVLTGENAGGKSSLLQILALTQQSWLEQPFDRGLLVNGAELKLGKCEDILNKQADTDVITFEIETDAVSLRLEFSAADRESSVAPFHSGPRIKTEPDWREHELPESLPGHGNRFSEVVVREFPPLLALRDGLSALQYITADRIGPKEIHDINYSGIYKTVGLRGERAVWFLNKYRKTPVPAGRCHEGQPPVLDKQVEAWMAEIFSGFQFAVTPIPGTDLATLGLATRGNPELIRPQNTGFGLSYTLPILWPVWAPLRMAWCLLKILKPIFIRLLSQSLWHFLPKLFSVVFRLYSRHTAIISSMGYARRLERKSSTNGMPLFIFSNRLKALNRTR